MSGCVDGEASSELGQAAHSDVRNHTGGHPSEPASTMRVHISMAAHTAGGEVLRKVEGLLAATACCAHTFYRGGDGMASCSRHALVKLIGFYIV